MVIWNIIAIFAMGKGKNSSTHPLMLIVYEN